MPPVVGVPVSAPDGSRTIPAGKLPPVTAKVHGETPPVAVSVWLYASVTVPVASDAGATVIVSHETLKVYDWKPAQPEPSNATAVKLTEPVADGVPDKTPAVERFMPDGSAPL